MTNTPFILLGRPNVGKAHWNVICRHTQAGGRFGERRLDSLYENVAVPERDLRFLRLQCGAQMTKVRAFCGGDWKLWALRPQTPLRLIRDGEIGGLGIIYLTPSRYTVTTGMIPH